MINYQLAFDIIVAISTIMVGFVIILFWYYIGYFFMANRKVKIFPKAENYTKFAVIIAARNESKVIRNIFEALKAQTYPKEHFDTWVIIEDKNDPTAEIAKEYDVKVFVRDRLTPDRKTKGFALQELTDYFKREEILYDAYMIFDADNVMEPAFIEKMNNVRQTGVKVCSGYRNFTNINANWLATCSAIMFAYMNQVTSRARSYLFHKCTLMGTGYYVDRQIIDDAGGWIFTGMTEDIQLTTYCNYHDVYMRYYPDAMFYDEQSTAYHDVHNQHVRWLAGYFASRKFLKRKGIKYYYHKTSTMVFLKMEFNVGLLPFLLYNIINALLCLTSFILFICACVFKINDPGLIVRCFGLTLYQFLCLYLPFVVASMYIVIKERKNLKITKPRAIVAISTYFFYFYDFLFAFFDGLFHKNKRIIWKQIEHTGETNKVETK